jgi:hypothetical protein
MGTSALNLYTAAPLASSGSVTARTTSFGRQDFFENSELRFFLIEIPLIS